jgi:hypothetical protein
VLLRHAKREIVDRSRVGVQVGICEHESVQDGISSIYARKVEARESRHTTRAIHKKRRQRCAGGGTQLYMSTTVDMDGNRLRHITGVVQALHTSSRTSSARASRTT